MNFTQVVWPPHSSEEILVFLPNAHFLIGRIRMATLQPLVISKQIELEGWEWS